MRTPSPSVLRRVLLAVCISLLALFALPSSAHAFGTIRIKSASVDEVDGQWKLVFDIDYGSKAHMPHIPFDLVITLRTYYEYSITDTDKEPQIRRKPMVNQQPSREGVDIDFADARGQIWPKTRFQINLRRDRGYSAGEYTLVFKRASDGAQLGATINLTLNGKNELIDRRAIVFTGAKPDAGAASKDAGSGDKSAATGADNASEADKDKAASAPEGAKSEEEKPAAAEPPPAEKKLPGGHGCGCRVAGAQTGAVASLLLFGLAFGALALRSRPRRRD
jgi:hypothetical protein